MSVDFLAHLRADSARFLEVLRDLDPSTPVPPCPDWTAADLLWHLAEVQGLWAVVVRDRVQDPSTIAAPQRPDDGELADHFRRTSDELAAAIEATPDDVEVWTWFDADHSAGFVRRRQAHEAVIHRLDAELTAGSVTDIDAELATDGVAEVLEWMYSEAPPWAEHHRDGAVGRVATTDTGAQWLVQLGRWSGTSPNSGTAYTDRPTLTPVPAGEPTFEVTGTARDLDAWLWNRPTLTDVTRSGAHAEFDAVIRSGVQ